MSTLNNIALPVKYKKFIIVHFVYCVHLNFHIGYKFIFWLINYLWNKFWKKIKILFLFVSLLYFFV